MDVSVLVRNTAPERQLPPVRRASRLSARKITFWATLLIYALVTLAVMFETPLLDLDRWFYGLHLNRDYHQFNRVALDYVMLGQRGPATLVFLPYFIWVAWRTRSSRPLVMLGTALVLLNFSVGVVKLLTGRLGPRQTRLVHEVFVGGDIYPSGHVTNAVVLYGLVAWITAWRYRKIAIAAAVFVVASVSFGTLYLNTHWFTDALGGWLAGALVLLALPSVMPTTQRWTDTIIGRVRARHARRQPADPARPPPPAQAPAHSTPVSSASVPAAATAAAAPSASSEPELDSGEFGGVGPQPARDARVPRRARRSDPARMPAQTP